MKWLWVMAGLVLTGLAVLGALLPVMPTTVFAIGAAGCFARSSPRLEAWLLRQPGIGPNVVAWRDEGAIPTPAKVMAVTAMTVSGIGVALKAPAPVAVGVGALLVGCAAYVVSRPAPRRRDVGDCP